jgi:hypothetical protein
MPDTQEHDTDERPAVSEPAAEVSAPEPIERTPPSLEETRRWHGFRLDDITGETVAKVEGIFVDAADERPRWLLVKLGFMGKHCLVPVGDAVGGAGRVWVPYEREWIRQAPETRGGKPLDQQAELAQCVYWGFAAADRAREIQEREAESLTARPVG